MIRFSANLGFLFTTRPLRQAIEEAKRYGFDAVELHWPFDTPADLVKTALGDLPLLCLNSSRGNAAAGEFGLSAVPGREAEARAAIDDAVTYAAEAGAQNVHVMAGKAQGVAAFDTFVANLRHAVAMAAPQGIGILVEPINGYDVPGYFLNSLPLARTVIEAVGSPNLRLMFDCYHVQRMHGDLLKRFEETLDIVGHVQFAGVPDRAEPDQGRIDYFELLPQFVGAGYRGFFGAEYRPQRSDMDWLQRFRQLG